MIYFMNFFYLVTGIHTVSNYTGSIDRNSRFEHIAIYVLKKD